jgi:DNA-binding transcriptional ArsR family regulator
LSKKKFTRIPKIAELVADGVPLRAVPTYLALADHANNKTGETFVSVARVAAVLRVCRRTVERHIKALERAGVIAYREQRRTGRGRFGSVVRVVLSIPSFTVRHSSTHGKRRPIFTRTKRVLSPSKSPHDSYRWLLGKEMQYHDQEISNEHGELALFNLV